MSGHSKWSQIKRKKAVVDAKKSQVFARLARDITLAARAGADPSMNAELARAVERALAANMPKENIERAIARGAGVGGADLIPLVLEAYGPGGVGLLIRAETDNKNRTVAELKNILTKHGVSLGGEGSVRWQFEQQGNELVVKQPVALAAADAEKVSLLVEALHGHEDVTEVLTTAGA